jgi:hypothetical protein
MDIQKIKELFEAGYSTREIADTNNYIREDVKKYIVDNNFKIKKESFSTDVIPHIMHLYENEGISAKNLGIKYSIGKGKIQKWAKERGTLRDKSAAGRLHFFNEHIFDKIDTEEKAYWLGFLYADAYNLESGGCVSLSLKIDDVPHLRKYVNFLGGEQDLILLRTDCEHPYATVALNSKYLSQKLKEIGCPQAKSFIIKWPEWLDEKLNFHFIRGIFDGDGSLTFSKKHLEYGFCIAGTLEICEAIRQIYLKEKIDIKHHCISKTNNNTHVVETSGNMKVYNILTFLYKNATVYLDRKYERFLKLKEQNIERHPSLFDKNDYNETIKIDDVVMNNENIKNLSVEEKEVLSKQLLERFLEIGFVYPNNTGLLANSYKNIVNHQPNLNTLILNNNGSTGTDICRFFCPEFFSTRTRDKESLIDAYQNPEKLENVIRYKLCLDGRVINNFNYRFSVKHIVDQFRDNRECAYISMFKPNIAKYMYMKYSNEGDTVGDYSCGFGGRLLAAMSCGRKYTGTDPLLVSRLEELVKYFEFKDAKLIQMGSEDYRGDENSLDFSFSSPPYLDLEIFSESLTQAYSKGENHFYNIYWRKTLENQKFMLKPEKWFGINVGQRYIKMIEIAKEYFGDVIEQVDLRSARYHFQGVGSKEKHEYIYMFKNNK